MEQDNTARFWDRTRTKLAEIFQNVTDFAMDNDPVKVTIRLANLALRRVIKALRAFDNWLRPKAEFQPLYRVQADTLLAEVLAERQKGVAQAKDVNAPLDGAGWAYYVRRTRRP